MTVCLSAGVLPVRFAFTVQYQGENFTGFQLQKENRTVQGELEKAFAVILREKVRVHCAGRTDTGVNALGQVIHIEVKNHPPELSRLIYAVNSLMGSDVSITHGQQVEDNFHARFSCLGREYVYVLTVLPYRGALANQGTLWLREMPQLDKIREAITFIPGEKDFAVFTRKEYVTSGAKTIRRIDAIQIYHRPPWIGIHVAGSGFLHNMIRILVGTLLDVGYGKIAPEDIGQIISSRDRLQAGLTVPAHALYFARALYEGYTEPDFIRNTPWGFAIS